MSKFQPPALPSQSPSFPPIAYRDVPVLTTDMLAQAYEVEAKQIRQNFANNRDRFVEGKHFFMLSGNNLREFKNCVENFDSVQIGKRAQSFTLWTERGAARHAKMHNSNREWDVFELLEDTFFRIVKPATLTPFIQIKVLPKARRDQLNELTLAKLTHVPPALIWKVRMSIWKAFNRHFAIPQYRLLPENRMAEAISFLSEMEVGPRGTVARKSAHLPLPLDEARQAISALTACIEQARSVLAALPESQRQETI